MLWIDKYRPKKLSDLTLHPEITDRLERLADSPNFPHLLVYGPEGSGRKTRVLALLHKMFGASVQTVRASQYEYTTGSKKAEIPVLMSNYHIELTPADAGNDDRVVVQQIIKEIASTIPVNQKKEARSFKVVVLNDVDRLSQLAQQALRRTMERYASSCRIVFVANSTSRLILPLRSRCLPVRVPAPSEEDIVQCMNRVADKELNIDCDDEGLARVAAQSRGDLRRALLVMQAMVTQFQQVNASTPLVAAEYELILRDIAATVVKKQEPSALVGIRSHLYTLLGALITPTTILETLVREIALLLRNDVVKMEMTFSATTYSSRINQGSMPIVHIEAFLARTMMLIAQSVWDDTLSVLGGSNPYTSDGQELSVGVFFRLVTLACMRAFRDEDCTAWVLETGIGGQYDHTNVVTPTASCITRLGMSFLIIDHTATVYMHTPTPSPSCITRLGMDHEHLLGSDIVSIAQAKAGIIKRERPCVTLPQHPLAMREIRDKAKRVHAPLSVVVPPYDMEGDTPLQGVYQRENAALSREVYRQMSGCDHDGIPLLAEGDVSWPDGAHTVDSVQSAMVWVRHSSRAPSGVPQVLVFGSDRRRNWREMLRHISEGMGPGPVHALFVPRSMSFQSTTPSPSQSGVDSGTQEMARYWDTLREGQEGERGEALVCVEHLPQRLLEIASDSEAMPYVPGTALPTHPTEGVRDMDVVCTGSLYLVGGVGRVLGVDMQGRRF
ncbi:hypothetical protein KIPB_000740 [Kipferlia bialata]|uniref:AAA+ ATPase domain-containing protein n=1 Tax=Kipferlia bialata TaxID=797122 RepID=A0A9K3CPN2_9EUKA|nr:hypothetical protein KIPB_000740 [Kipferlia bialata]|eukprot:g740.t1